MIMAFTPLISETYLKCCGQKTVKRTGADGSVWEEMNGVGLAMVGVVVGRRAAVHPHAPIA